MNQLYVFLSFLQKSSLQQLAEALILSKIDYALLVLSNANKMEINQLQKVLKLAASFITYRFCHTTDATNLKWLPIAK